MGDLVLGDEHAERTGVKLLNDYHVKGQHRLLLVVEADGLRNAEDYAKPFSMVGNTQVLQLDRCAAVMQEVVARLEAQTTGVGSAIPAATSTGCGCKCGRPISV